MFHDVSIHMCAHAARSRVYFFNLALCYYTGYMPTLNKTTNKHLQVFL